MDGPFRRDVCTALPLYHFKLLTQLPYAPYAAYGFPHFKFRRPYLAELAELSGA